jgi:hypothetical protein
MMNKDAFYFPHFANARHDRRIKRVRKELGLEGYGIFFMLLEVLREQSEYRYPMEDVDLLADEFGTSEQKVRTVLSNYGLFEIDGEEHFFSSKLIMYLKPYLDGKERKRIAGIKGNLIRYGHCTKEDLEGLAPHEIEQISLEFSQNSHSDRIPIAAPRKGKERKGKEIKEKESKAEEEFCEWWNEYPKKVDKQKSKAKYLKLYESKDFPLLPNHIEILKEWKKTKKWKDGYIPNPTTWLNGARWEDELPKVQRDHQYQENQTELNLDDNMERICNV